MDANQIIDTIYKISITNYRADEPMRWPYQVGMLESKIRELVFELNDRQQAIDQLTTDIEKIRNELSELV